MGSLGPTEIILILLVVVLLFGAKKLPELARGSGRALRIFKSETKGLMDDDRHSTKDDDDKDDDDKDDEQTDPHGRPLPAGSDVQQPARPQPTEPTVQAQEPSSPDQQR